MAEISQQDNEHSFHRHRNGKRKSRRIKQSYRGSIGRHSSLWNKDGWDHMLGREEDFFVFGHAKWICWHCRFTSGMSQIHPNPQCPTCGYEMKRLDGRARVPRRDALESKWRRFEVLFKKGN
jgi:hypothetical protein